MGEKKASVAQSFPVTMVTVVSRSSRRARARMLVMKKEAVLPGGVEEGCLKRLRTDMHDP